MNRKGQISIEAMIVIGIIFLIFLGLYFLYQNKNSEVLSSEKILAERADCLKLANAYSNVFILGKNSEMRINLEHEMSVQPEQLRIETEHTFCILPTKIVYKDGILATAPFTLEKGEVTIKNEG